MYLKETNAVANLKNIPDAYLRTQLSYFMYNDPEPWEKLIDYGTAIRLEKGKSLQENIQYVYFIREGVIRFSRLTGKEVMPLFYLGRGSLCFEMHAIGHISASSDCCALEDCSLIRFPTKRLRQLVVENPHVGFLIAESIGIKYSVLLTRVTEMGTQHLLRNIARLLLDMVSFFNFSRIITPSISQRELAEFFCVHRSSVNRAIAVLREKNIIGDYTKSRLEIRDLPALINLASVAYI